MLIAYTLAPGRGETNVLISDLADMLTSRGLRLCGTVQTDTENAADGRCDMDVRVLPDGPVIRISQSLGTESRGCRLDPDALEQAVALSLSELDKGADLLIVNKFGKHEADGRGFREVIAAALERDVPVLVGANKLNLEALNAFCDGRATALPPQTGAIVNWVIENTKGAGQI